MPTRAWFAAKANVLSGSMWFCAALNREPTRIERWPGSRVYIDPMMVKGLLEAAVKRPSKTAAAVCPGKNIGQMERQKLAWAPNTEDPLHVRHPHHDLNVPGFAKLREYRFSVLLCEQP